jgi:CspA family cold shock protein
VSALERSGILGLAEGQKVTYDLEPGRDGKLSATNLQLT